MTHVVAGVDGCRGGWICVLRNVEPPLCERVVLAAAFSEILNHPGKPAIIAVDIPIGLPEKISGAGRECDVLARLKLGKRAAAAVFAVPARPALMETDYRRACATALTHSEPPRQISKQMFNLFPKIREVDGVITRALQGRIFECHPEAAFWAMNGEAALHEPKKLKGREHPPGLELRRALLREQGYGQAFLREQHLPRSKAGQDDFLDACACAWTAARIFRGEAIRFPPHPPLDAKGLRMEILV
jgi:predicted RNase H-like nuclease